MPRCCPAAWQQQDEAGREPDLWGRPGHALCLHFPAARAVPGRAWCCGLVQLSPETLQAGAQPSWCLSLWGRSHYQQLAASPCFFVCLKHPAAASREELSIYLDWLFFMYLGVEVVQMSGKLSLVGWGKSFLPVLCPGEGKARYSSQFLSY